ncbi:MAG: hypothetical protein HC888_13560 [Candidatus Competibacteraceae bacterium]|nr:hypothetical protein [Candidatus Competibacteraceae bacterium]
MLPVSEDEVGQAFVGGQPGRKGVFAGLADGLAGEIEDADLDRTMQSDPGHVVSGEVEGDDPGCLRVLGADGADVASNAPAIELHDCSRNGRSAQPEVPRDLRPVGAFRPGGQIAINEGEVHPLLEAGVRRPC